MKGRELARWGGLALLYAVMTLVCLRGSPEFLTTRVAPDVGDPVFNLVVLDWMAQEWREGIPNNWDAPFFHPTKGTILLSDHLLGPSAFAALAMSAGANLLLAYNLMFLGSFLVSGLATAWVFRKAGLGWAAAAFGGAAFAVSPFRMDHLSHLQILLAGTVPLVLWFWHRLLAERHGRDGVFFLLAYALHVTGGNYLAYMIHVPMLAMFALALWREGRALLRPESLRLLAPVALVAAGLLGWVFLPYALQEGPIEPTRSSGEWQTFGATLVSYITPAANSRWTVPLLERHRRGENALFAGWVTSGLALLGLFWLWRTRQGPARPRPGVRWPLVVSAALALGGFALAEVCSFQGLARFSLFGTAIRGGYRLPLVLITAGAAFWFFLAWRRRGGWPLPSLGATAWEKGLLAGGAASLLLTFPVFFAPAAYLLPGLDRMRVPARFYAFASLAIAWLAARAVEHLRARWPARRGAVLAALLLALHVAEVAPRRVDWNWLPQEGEIEPVYHWLEAQEDVSAILELPFGEPLIELSYMYRQTFHHKPMVNGYSGFFPPTFYAIQQVCCWPAPNDEALRLLRQLGVSHILVHPPKRWGAAKYRELDAFAARPDVERVFVDTSVKRPIQVFRLLAPP